MFDGMGINGKLAHTAHLVVLLIRFVGLNGDGHAFELIHESLLTLLQQLCRHSCLHAKQNLCSMAAPVLAARLCAHKMPVLQCDCKLTTTPPVLQLPRVLSPDSGVRHSTLTQSTER